MPALGCLACLIAVIAAASVHPAHALQLQYSAPPKGRPPARIKLKAGAIVSSSNDSSRVDVKAAEWGAGPDSEPFSTFVHIRRPEAASSSSSISRALVAAAYQLRQQGYNAVSLPFCFSDLLQGPDSSSTQQQTGGSQLCQQLPLAELTSTSQKSASSGAPAAAWQSGSLHHRQQRATAQAGAKEAAAAAGTAAGTSPQEPQACLSLLPNSTTLDRYLWSVQWFVANGLYVILSSSSNPASCGSSHSNISACTTAHSSSSVGFAQDAAASADAWVRLWRAVVALPDYEGSLRGRLLLLLAQDAAGDSSSQQWASITSSTGQKLQGLQETYLATMDAVDSVSRGSALFILQGPQQEGQYPGAATPTWGSGFSTEPALISQGASDPTPLIKALLDKPYRDQVILSPRVFSPRQSNSSSSSSTAAGSTSMGGNAPAAAAAAATEVPLDGVPPTGPGPTKVLDNAPHHLSSLGFCVAEGSCHRFPVAVMQQQQKQREGSVADSELELFASLALSRQAEGAAAADEAASGNWLHWDVMGDTAPAGLEPQPQDVGPTKQAAGAAAAKGAGSTGSVRRQGEGTLTFVYTADTAGGAVGSFVDAATNAGDMQQ